MKEITLIQLASEQPLPNVLATMALRPHRIIHCNSPSMRKHSEHLVRACHAASLKSDMAEGTLSAMPKPRELTAMVKHLVNVYQDAALNGWSVFVGSRDNSGTDKGKDILGVDGLNLLYASCKRVGDRSRLSRTIENDNSSAHLIGYSHTYKMLAVFIPPTGIHIRRIRNRCKELNITLLIRKDICNEK